MDKFKQGYAKAEKEERIKRNVKNFRERHPDYWKGCYNRYGKKSYEKNKEHISNYRTPIKIKAWNNANDKVIIPKGQLCEFCNKNLAILKHHFDYNKPLDVTFLCNRCHIELHAKLSHSPQKSEAKVDNTSNTSLRGVTKFKEVRYAKSSSPSGDTHIRKEKPDCFLGGVPVKEKK